MVLQYMGLDLAIDNSAIIHWRIQSKNQSNQLATVVGFQHKGESYRRESSTQPSLELIILCKVDSYKIMSTVGLYCLPRG